MTLSITNNRNYLRVLNDIKSRIQSARIKATHEVNRELIDLYWNIGKIIVEKQAQLDWGKAIVETLSKDILKEFPGISGYSPDNLWRMRQFYVEYSDTQILEQLVPALVQLFQKNGKAAKNKFLFLEQPVPEMPGIIGSQVNTEWVLNVLKQLVERIPWGHNLLIMKKVKDIHSRLYYIISAARCGWSRNVLLNQINADAYSRHCLENKQHNFSETLPKHLAEQADEAIKDSYMLDFLGITKPVLEREMERRMVNRIRDVLIEFGHGFAFMGNQYRIKTGTKEYFIDLLFYHRKLKCLVAIELKMCEFKPEYAGKMNFYLNLLDDYIREDDENPSIGIILCAERDRLEVEYALRGIDKPVGVAEYRLTTELPADLRDNLPSVENIKAEILKEMKNENG
ncbi:MAG TPA: PDDEXK nuclease domain-containing protein [Candidatus Deferrimicrobium sp.]|nr:PDDEXK nuclease domain-containing protein [Candidatus Kapabacteria bacterium]HLP59638.1 PDDEXK nuclease domain-containing protein [Candidatus Deferrimicrobium sp.]